MNIYYTEVLLTNTCDRPYSVAQAAARDYTTLLHPNLFTTVSCSAQTFVSIPLQSWHPIIIAGSRGEAIIVTKRTIEKQGVS